MYTLYTVHLKFWTKSARCRTPCSYCSAFNNTIPIVSGAFLSVCVLLPMGQPVLQSNHASGLAGSGWLAGNGNGKPCAAWLAHISTWRLVTSHWNFSGPGRTPTDTAGSFLIVSMLLTLMHVPCTPPLLPGVSMLLYACA